MSLNACVMLLMPIVCFPELTKLPFKGNNRSHRMLTFEILFIKYSGNLNTMGRSDNISNLHQNHVISSPFMMLDNTTDSTTL